MDDNLGYIFYHGKRSSEFGIGINIDNPRPHANKSFSFVDVPGRSGSLLEENNDARANVQLQLKADVYLPSRYPDFDDLEDDIVDWLNGSEYQYLGLSWKPNYLYRAIVQTLPTFQPDLDNRDHETTTLIFEVEPFKYQQNFVKWMPLPQSKQVTNDENIDAVPDWHIVGNGDFVLNVGGFPYLFNGVDGDIYIDGQTQQAYDANGNDLNDDVQWANNDAPRLVPGQNVVDLEPQAGATLTKAEWRPKYRRSV